MNPRRKARIERARQRILKLQDTIQRDHDKGLHHRCPAHTPEGKVFFLKPVKR